jgi:mannose-6-phosphate isomerase-like protein (cupin superfamily)
MNILNHFIKHPTNCKCGCKIDSKSQDRNQPIGEIHKPYHGNIEQQTIKNPNYRDTLFTGKHSQLIVMSLKPKEQIGNEVHPHVDQFFRIEQGKAKFSIDNGKEKYVEGNGGAVMVPSGHYHNVTNASNKKPLKLYTIYSPSNHPPGTKQKNRPKND